MLSKVQSLHKEQKEPEIIKSSVLSYIKQISTVQRNSFKSLEIYKHEGK
jgi:hypothetical protein